MIALIADISPDVTLDCRDLVCPMPILKTKNATKNMKPRQILEVLATDPATKNDLPSFAGRCGHEYLGAKEDQGFTRYYVRIK